MTAKEKAKELHLRFLRERPFDNEIVMENEHGYWDYEDEILAKNHALTCVDEIMKTIFHEPSKGKYWQEVNQEIKKL